jgi:enoyl-CoA hydratase/carnithine racemase
MTSPVLFSLVPLDNGKDINGTNLGHAILNLPGSLNALNLEMVELLTKQLTLWQQDDSVSGVLISGAGDKAFCAGGDVVSLYKAMQQQPGETPADVQAFFTQEYQLDHLIHRFSKPLIVWGSGFIMGGGIGLFAGASHKVVTETSRLAMPEITIGLFPDVGGSWCFGG